MRKRLIPCIFLKDGMIIRSEDFIIHQIIGNPISEVKRFSDWAVDEIIYIDISHSNNFQVRRNDHKDVFSNNNLELLSEISKNISVPLAFGGGVRTIEHISSLLQMGADKVILNTGIFSDEELLKTASKIFGAQALVACVDYKQECVFFSHGKIRSKYTVQDWCLKIESEGIGEILLNDISRDGKSSGFNIDMVKNIVKQSSVPVIALGGAGDYDDFVECFKEANPSAVAAGNIFHFKEHSYYHAKKTLERSNIDIRTEYGVFS